MTLGDVVDAMEEKDPPMKRVPSSAESVDMTVEFDQHRALTSPPGSVLPSTRKVPSDDCTKTVSPSVEKEGVDEVASEEGDHQSRPENDPPKPTLPMREKST